MNRMENEEIQIDMARLMRFYLKNWKKIVVMCMATVLLSILFTLFWVTPMYRSSVTIYVNNSKNVQTDMVTGSNLSASIHLAKTYVNIIKSKPVLEEVIRRGNLDCSTDALYRMIQAEQIDETEIFVVTAVDTDPEQAAHIVNTIAKVAPDRIAEIVEGSSAKIVELADPAKHPYTPNIKKNILLGGLLGGFIAIALLTMQYLFDMRVENEEDVLSNFGLPVLGSIPLYEETEKGAGAAKQEEYHMGETHKKRKA